MRPHCITLTTDFGLNSVYVAAMKGAILSIAADAHLLDLSHSIEPGNLFEAGFFLAGAIPFFPAGSVHLVVVDPGVGSKRKALYVEWEGHTLLAPDNGCWTPLSEKLGAPKQVRELLDPQYWRGEISSTFHGRDVFGPVAGHLALGLEPSKLGPALDRWRSLPARRPKFSDEEIEAQVAYVDVFGNLITNLDARVLGDQVHRWFACLESVIVGPVLKSYSDTKPGELLLLTSSFGLLEIACNGGSAASLLGLGRGSPIRFRPSPAPNG